ncbi:DUF5085 family protein [Oceanobacillus kimchii]|uniref:DUF5085 family protein n=1 Tax=Oceanobacillus kimchii TaxID=746691 RepID=UPI003C74A00D
MAIEKSQIHFTNLLVYEKVMLRSNWQDGVAVMEDFTLNEDIYRNGPIFFSVESIENEPKFGKFTYFLPINEEVTLSEHPNFRFVKEFVVDDALLLRQATEEVDFHTAYEKIRTFAVSENIKLNDTFYCFILEVYEDIIIDVHVPLKQGVGLK